MPLPFNRFAHLGTPEAKARRAAENAAKAGAEDDQDDKNKTPKKAPADEEEQDEARERRKSKKGKAADQDDEDEGDDTPEAERKARARERGRIRAILTSAPAHANIVGAAHLALDTTMSRGAAIAALESLNDALAASAAARAAEAGGSARATAAGIIAAGMKARGETPPVPRGRGLRMGYAEGEEPPPEPRRGTALDVQGRPVSEAAQAILAAGRRRRGEA